MKEPAAEKEKPAEITKTIKADHVLIKGRMKMSLKWSESLQVGNGVGTFVGSTVVGALVTGVWVGFTVGICVGAAIIVGAVEGAIVDGDDVPAS